MEVQKVVLKVISSEGDTEITLPVDLAIAKAKQLCAQESKWLYLDGEFVNPNNIVKQNFIDAEERLLANQLTGGQ